MSLTSGLALHLALPLALAFLTLAARFTLSFADEVCAPRLLRLLALALTLALAMYWVFLMWFWPLR